MTFAASIRALPPGMFTDGAVSLRPIADDWDLWYAAVQCRLAPGQEDFVNPPGFSIGRAYLCPEDNLPCVVLRGGERVGFLQLRRWPGGGEASTWTFCIDADHQGQGIGTAAASLALRILKAAHPHLPVKLAVEEHNRPGQKLYESIGFVRTDERDGDELVYRYG